MSIVDLDKARAARREVTGEAIEVVLSEETFTFPVELPFDALPYLAAIVAPHENLIAFEAAVTGLLGVLLGEERADLFMGLKPTLDDLQTMLKELLRTYGVTSGEASASKS